MCECGKKQEGCPGLITSTELVLTSGGAPTTAATIPAVKPAATWAENPS